MFKSGNPVSREEMVTMLFRYAKGIGVDTKSSAALGAYRDNGTVSSWAREAMEWAVANGIIKGSGGMLNPAGAATRAEVATILQRMVELIVK